MENYKAETILALEMTQKEFGKLIGTSQPRVAQLIDEGIIVRSEVSGKIRVIESLRNYYLSKNASGDGVSYWTERSLHEKAKRQLRQREGELYEAAEVERELAEWLTEFRTKLLGTGHKLAKVLEGKTAAQICDIIDSEIIEILEELSENVEDAQYKEEHGAEAEI